MSSVGPGSADWDDIYLGDGSDTEPFDDQLLADALKLLPGRALDLGCGGGGNAIGLAQRGWNTTGVDSATNAIRSARISAEAAHVEVRFAVADMTSWPPDGLYDLVVCSYSLPPRGRDRQALLATAVQALGSRRCTGSGGVGSIRWPSRPLPHPLGVDRRPFGS